MFSRINALGLSLGRGRGGLLVHGLAKLAHAFAEGARDFRQALGAQHEQRDSADEQQMNWALDTHRA
jgi:hypothetical protein